MVFYIAQCYTFAVHNATLLYYTKQSNAMRIKWKL